MVARTVLIADYASASECCHVVRRTLQREPGPLHDHDCHELFWIESGASEHRVNGVDVALVRGDAVFVRPGDRHRLASSGAGACRIGNLMFDSGSAAHLGARYAVRLTGRLFWSTAELPDTVSLSESGLERLGALADRLVAGPRGLAHIECFLLEVLTDLIDEAPDAVSGPALAGLPAWLQRACRAVQDPAVFRLGAAGLVAASGKSHEHVCRAVRRHLDTSPSAYVNHVRMMHAATLLADGDESILQVSLACGIDNVSHFYRLFRHSHGTTPGAYRQACGRACGRA